MSRKVDELAPGPSVGPSSGAWKRSWAEYTFWVVLLLVLGWVAHSLSLALGAAGLVVVVQVLEFALAKRRDAVASQRVLDRLNGCFAASAEPELLRIYEALAGADELARVAPAKEWTDRYQLGMVTRAEYYTGMRRFLEAQGAAPAARSDGGLTPQ